MAKLHYKHGTMGAGKSLDLVRVAYSYKERNMNSIIMKPIIDTRDGITECIIKSRTGASIHGEWIYEESNIFANILKYIETNQDKLHVILIDEVQFLSIEQIEQLQQIVMDLHIPVICYGLKNDFQGNLFPAISKLLAICDDIEVIRNLCWCGKLAKQNARINHGQVIKEGALVHIGGNDEYVALCNEHYYKGQLQIE